MRSKKLALIMAAVIGVTSVPVNNLTGYAEETAEEELLWTEELNEEEQDPDEAEDRDTIFSEQYGSSEGTTQQEDENEDELLIEEELPETQEAYTEETEVSETERASETETEIDEENLIEEVETDAEEIYLEINVEEKLADSFHSPGAATTNPGARKTPKKAKGQSAAYNTCYGVQLSGLAYEIYVELVSYYATDKGIGNHEYSLQEPLSFTAEWNSNGELIENEEYSAIKKALSIALQSAIDAFSYDHPEAFWMGLWSYSYSPYSIVGTSNEASISKVIFQPSEIVSGLSSKVAQYDSNVQSAIASIQSELGTVYDRYDAVKAIHDYVCNNMYYNISGNQTVYSSAGAFIGDGGLVCEGYAKTFKVLCDKMGIPCVCIGGVANTSSGANKDHMWNYVQMDDGAWYLIDATWDDQESKVYDTYLLAGADSQGFYEVISDERTANNDFSNTGNFSFVLPVLSSTGYIYLKEAHYENTIIDTCLQNTMATVYDPELSYQLMKLASAVYDTDSITNEMTNMGMDAYMLANYDKVANVLDGKVAYCIGYRKKNKICDFDVVVIVVRGTSNLSDALRDINMGFGAVQGVHEGFFAAARDIYNNMQSFTKAHGLEEGGKVKYIVTGHSLGAAAANLTEYLLINNGISQADIYGYNFACPDTAKLMLFPKYECIYNIGNVGDPVSVIPGLLADVVIKSPGAWGKFGNSVWFSPDWSSQEGLSIDVKKHECEQYLNYLEGRPAYSTYLNYLESKYRQLVYLGDKIGGQIKKIGRLFKIECPVDVIIKDENNRVIASVIDGIPSYNDALFGNIMIATNEEHKYIYVADDGKYSVEVIATDNGSMDFTVSRFDLFTGLQGDTTSFEDVDLIEGNHFTYAVDNTYDIQDTVLVDTGKNEEILPTAVEPHIAVVDAAREATCTEDGISEGSHCEVCGKVLQEQEVVPALGHSIVIDEAIAETCVENGLSEGSHCSVCGEVIVKQEIIPATGHDYSDWKVVKEPTEITEGQKIRTCTVCGNEEISVIEKLAHQHIEVKDSAVKATCTETGLTEGTHCSVCNEVIVPQKIVPATGHTWDDGKVTKAATEISKGVKTYTCTECGETKTEDIPILRVTNPEGDPGDKTSVAAAEKEITAMSDTGEPAGSSFAAIQVKSSKQTKTSITISWNKVSGATGYIIYGNQCGKNKPFKRLAKQIGTSYTYKKLKKGTYYKFSVVAYKTVKGKETIVASGKTIHVATKGGKVTNVSKVKLSKSKVKLKKGGIVKVKATAVKQTSKLTLKTHRKIKFESSNKKIATVDKNGKIKAKGKGTCYIYAYSQNGVYSRVKVTVK